MFSVKKNVLETVALLKAHGISEIVLSPGSRNAPLIQSFTSDVFFHCHSVVDERSAGFFALGLIMAKQTPVVVCCTSGTAVQNYGPAVAEAFYQELPLVVVSADRVPAWIGQMDGQTLPQAGIFGSLVRKSVQVPEIHTEEDLWHCNRLVNEALNACKMRGFGPVHLNIPISEPLFDFSVTELPAVRRLTTVFSDTVQDIGTFVSTFLLSSRPMIVVGQRLPEESSTKTDELSALLDRLLKAFGVVVLAEHLGNLRLPDAIGSFDTVIAGFSSEEKKAMAPDLLITLGGHVVSKQLKHFLRSHQPEHHWHLAKSDSIPDVYQGLTDFVQADPVVFIKKLLKSLLKIDKFIELNVNDLKDIEIDYLNRVKINRNAYSKAWVQCSNSRNSTALEPLIFSDLLVTKTLLHVLPKSSVLFVGNSSSVRNIQLFPLPEGCKVFCNRGTSGIEGTLSSACGYASATEELVFVELGDLSFFYDLNILTHRPFPKNLRILLPNNGGGGIFQMLNGLEKAESFDRFVSAGHDLEAQEWVKAAGLIYLRVGSTDPELDTAGSYWPEEGLAEAMAELIRKDWKRSVVLEVMTSPKANKTAFERYHKN
jgi:2-succinyl-5-enolpyruvyl-6-hydroxy-3-cyclohexene-1-carboxylate synthase